MQISREERDALWDHLISDLMRAGDLPLVLSHGDVDAARRLHKRYAEDVRLLEIIGWQRAHFAQSFELPTESDPALADTLRRLGTSAGAALAGTLLEVDLGAIERLARVCQVGAGVGEPPRD